MPRQPRYSLPSEFSHVTIRGLGRRIIFEDTQDKQKFLRLLLNKLSDTEVFVYAWCLMDNHAHFLFRASSANLSKMMQRLGTSYAQYYNGRHGHVGKVFQNRFNALPIESVSHLLATIRYIHRNALDTGFAFEQYAWSSYHEIVNMDSNAEKTVDTDAVLELFGGLDRFLAFHNIENETDSIIRIDNYRRKIDDAEARDIASKMFGKSFSDLICAMQKSDRDKAIAKLRYAGLSIRQIERLTGVGRGVIGRISPHF